MSSRAGVPASWRERIDKDPALVELVFSESTRVVRAEPGVLITETVGGWIAANAGIDSSNLEEGLVSLLPADGDESARRIRNEIRQAGGASPGVVIADSFGRPWRMGQADIAIGCAGVVPLSDWRGKLDRHGRELSATVIAVADELASAADLSRDKDSGVPGAIVAGRGDVVTAEDGPGAAPPTAAPRSGPVSLGEGRLLGLELVHRGRLACPRRRTRAGRRSCPGWRPWRGSSPARRR